MAEKLTFIASLPPIKSAILLDGMGDGGQVKLEVSREESGALLLLQHGFAGKSFRVTVEEIPVADGIQRKSRKIHIRRTSRCFDASNN